MIKKAVNTAWFKYVNGRYSHFAHLERSQWWSREEIEAYQFKLFKDLLRHSYDNVPYYRSLFNRIKLHPDRITCRNDIQRIPFLTKQDIRNHYDNLIAENIDKRRFRRNSTSGSTGETTHFLRDRCADKLRLPFLARAYSWMGVRLFDPSVVLWGAPFDVVQPQGLIERIKAMLRTRVVLSSYNLNEEDMHKYYEFITRYRPKLIAGYPSPLAFFAEFLQHSHLIYHPRAVLTSAEKLYPHQRAIIADVFQCKVYDFYGARDAPAVAQECEKQEGLHIFSEYVLVEVIDSEGRSVRDGEGDIVITNLHNYVMPFIRYKIEDEGIITSRKCSCGRGLPLLEEVKGRTFDVVRFPNGNSVGGTFWTLLFRSERGINKFQVMQERIDAVEIKFVAEPDFDARVLEHFEAQIREKAGNEVTINFSQVERIPRTRSGKYRFVISKISNSR